MEAKEIGLNLNGQVVQSNYYIFGFLDCQMWLKEILKIVQGKVFSWKSNIVCCFYYLLVTFYKYNWHDGSMVIIKCLEREIRFKMI